MKKNRRISFLIPVGIAMLALISGVTVVLASGSIDSVMKWAWGSNVGWIDFAPEYGGVTVYDDHLEGYAWGENIGWIRMGTCESGSPCTYANTDKEDYGVNHDGAGKLSGYAWSSNVGWINFDPDGEEQVVIDPKTGDLSGYAWGENIGWISFQNANLPEGYGVNTTWRAASPIANAGEDQTVKVNSLVTLDGSASYDPDGHLPLTYQWAQVGGKTVVLSDATAAQPTFTAPDLAEQLIFELKVTDSLEIESDVSDEVIIFVEEIENAPPIANAGEDQTVKVNSLVTLDGSASYDPDGHLLLTYQWAQVGGETVVLSDATAVLPTFTAPGLEDIVIFKLSVTDSLGLISSLEDEVTIFVEPNLIYLPLLMK